MKVVILGPIINDKFSGGVGTFVEGLYHGFCQIGDDCIIISNSKSKYIDNIVVAEGKSIFLSFGKIAKIINQLQPDLVISSLQYSVGIKKFKKINITACFVQVLHGVAWPINGRLKAFLVNGVAKYSRKHFDRVVTVSYLSYALNLHAHNIKCDAVIHNGCQMEPTIDSNGRTRNFDVIYIGRLFRDKNVEQICDAFIELLKQNSGYKFAIGGYGELEYLFTTGKYKNTGIVYLGKLNPLEVRQYLAESDFFISMNPIEPFGIVFNEAVISGCNIITQSTSGISSLLIKKPYFHIADAINSTELAASIQKSLEQWFPVSNDERVSISQMVSYKEVAKQYKDLYYRK